MNESPLDDYCETCGVPFSSAFMTPGCEGCEEAVGEGLKSTIACNMTKERAGELARRAQDMGYAAAPLYDPHQQGWCVQIGDIVLGYGEEQ